MDLNLKNMGKQKSISYGLRPVNCGDIVQANMVDIYYNNKNIQVEVLEHTKHNPECDIICYYFSEAIPNSNRTKKVEVTIGRNIKTQKYFSEVYFFKDKDSLQHYYSRRYDNFVGLKKEYYTIVTYIHTIFLKLFG